LLQLDELSVHHQQARVGVRGQEYLKAVQQLSVDISPGEILAVVGESGSGKTTLARAIVGMLPATSGAIFYRGKDTSKLGPADHAAWRQGVQLLFQDPHSSLSPRRRILQSLAEPLELQTKVKREDRQALVHQALADVNLPADILGRYPHQLSGGQKQRVALARALISQPELIIADEPMSALDVSEQARLLELIHKLRAERNIAFMLVSHELAVVQQLADRVGVMYLGRMVELAPAGRFFEAAAHPYSQALLKATRRNWENQGDMTPVLAGEPPSALTPPAGCVFHSRCERALDTCAQQSPPGLQLRDSKDSAPAHMVECHLYTESHKSTNQL
jgi:oligopeptide/dipeptide ABC transporter ATP-binding protein